MKVSNLFDAVPADLPGEVVEVVAEGQGKLRIERIVSRGHASPPDFWYHSSETEWVVLLSGSAMLQFADMDEPVLLAPGDWMEIPARCRHRVAATSEEEDSVWLAVHWG